MQRVNKVARSQELVYLHDTHVGTTSRTCLHDGIQHYGPVSPNYSYILMRNYVSSFCEERVAMATKRIIECQKLSGAASTECALVT